MRLWGIVTSSAFMAAALTFSFWPAARVDAQPAAPPAAASTAAPQPLAFLVKFRGQGPIARAQALAARGQLDRAGRQVAIQLQRQAAFAGLCFDRFTAGGVEIVLRTCDAVPASARAQAQRTWLARLQAMRAVDYVDANATASRNSGG